MTRALFSYAKHADRFGGWSLKQSFVRHIRVGAREDLRCPAYPCTTDRHPPHRLVYQCSFIIDLSQPESLRRSWMRTSLSALVTPMFTLPLLPHGSPTLREAGRVGQPLCKAPSKIGTIFSICRQPARYSTFLKG